MSLMLMPELFNISIILLVIFIAYNSRLIPLWCAVTLAFLLATPFMLNGVLFSPNYMPDQFLYFDRALALRQMNFDAAFTGINHQLKTATIIFSFAPLPFLDSLFSLAFVNRLIFTILFVWLYAHKNMRDFSLIFLLFYPSLLLYSSLALRDTMVLTSMIVAVIQFLDRRWVNTIIFLTLTYFLKPQNAMIIALFFVVYSILTPGNKLSDNKFIIIAVGSLCSVPFVPFILERLDALRWIMFLQDERAVENYISISSLENFLLEALFAGPNFLLKPLLTEASGFLQIIQSIENIFTAMLIVTLLRLAWVEHKNIALKWALFLLISMTIYGLVVFNFGTAARYKYTFVTVFVLGIYYDYYITTGLKITAPIILTLSRHLKRRFKRRADTGSFS